MTYYNIPTHGVLGVCGVSLLHSVVARDPVRLTRDREVSEASILGMKKVSEARVEAPTTSLK